MIQKALFFSYSVMIFSLGFMQPSASFFGFSLPLTDFIFPFVFLLWLIALFSGKIGFRRHKIYFVLAVYAASMILPVIFSENPTRSFIKLSSQIYLLFSAVLTINLVQTESAAKKVVLTWLAATFLGCLVIICSIVLFYADRDNSFLYYTLSHFGTLPPGNYPRLRGTFLNANMLCNYLNVGVVFLLLARKFGWISGVIFYTLSALILIAILTTISPGIGGILLVGGIWFWMEFNEKKKPLAARFFLISGIFAAVIFFASTLISPNVNPLSPFVFKIPSADFSIYPSVRVLGWTQAVENISATPFFGRGLGLDAVSVSYYNAEGNLTAIRDAHQLWLNYGVQTGIFGLFALLFLTFYLLRKVFPPEFFGDSRSIFRAAFGLAFLGSFVYQGLAGSFEDARHLWILIGLFASFHEKDDNLI